VFGGRTAAGPKPSFRPAVEALEERVVPAFILTSLAFPNGGAIPKLFAKRGGISPPLAWQDPPAGTMSFALFMDDVSIRPSLSHWVLYNIPASTLALNAGIPPVEFLDNGTLQGLNGNGVLDLADFGSVRAGGIGYLGPNPTQGPKKHTYVFTLYALNTQLNLQPGQTGATQLLDAVLPNLLAVSEISGTFKR
jgi:Raf kinase inhibitor-like YbhB/YbcL family protein